MRTALNILIAFMMVGMVGFAPNAFADDVTVEVRAISATQSGKSFDSQLNDIKRKLKKVFGGYTSFKQVDRDTVKVPKKGNKSISLPNGSKLKVTYHGRQGKFVRLGLGIPKKIKTTIRATPGSTLFQAGLDYKGGILILAITVK